MEDKMGFELIVMINCILLYCMSDNGYGHVVDICPHNETEVTAAATRLNCTEDKFKNTWYTCVPRRDLAALAEFCYNATDKVSLFPKDYCLRIEPSGVLQSYSCGQFTEGCPSDHYRRADLYQFPACSQINTDQRCFYADPSCPNEKAIYTPEDGDVPTESTRLTEPPQHKSECTETWNHTTPVEQGSVDVGLIIGCVVAVLFVFCIVLAVVFWRRRRRRRRRRYSSVPMKDLESEQAALVEDLELMETDLHLRKREDYEIRIEESKWKTATSEKIGFLPAEQKCILYSLLAYDSWSDSEQWLSTLNDIRGTLFDAGSVSVKDTERDIKELKKMDFVQNNRQCLRISSTDYAEDVMYQLCESTRSKFGRNHSYMLTLLCVTLVRKYCVTINPDKMLYCGYGLSPSLVYRLQMDILTQPTMEHWSVGNAASWLLNLPEEILQSQQRRTYMYNDLRSRIYRGDVRKLGAVSWSRMTREDKGRIVYELRPQCARSTIGQHDYNDIFIMQGEMYALKDEFQPVHGDIEDLYTVLLSDRFSIPFDTRYIFDGITEKTGDVVRFVSDRVRHQVMYSYLVSKLLTDDAMRVFINEASADCLVEYGRLWYYQRKKGEPCLFIPQDMEKLYMEKIGYAVIKHVQILEQVTPWKDIKEKYDIPSDLFIKSQEIRHRFVEYVNDERKRQGDHAQPLKYMYSAFLFNKDGCKSAEQICCGEGSFLSETTGEGLLSQISAWRRLNLEPDFSIGKAESGGKSASSMNITPWGKVHSRDILPEISRDFNGNIEDLYAVLLSDRFSVPFDTRYIFDGITEKTGDVVRFVSDTVRHQVMYSYIVSKLLTDEGMRAFINEASADCLVEYGRLWRYRRKDGEPCLFIPRDMEELYMEKIGYAALKHVQFLEQVTPWTDIKDKQDIPFDLCLQSLDFRNRFVDYVHDERKRQRNHVHLLKYMYSAFLFNKDGCLSTELITESNWPILLTILTSNGYEIERPGNVSSRPMPKVVKDFLNISEIDFNKLFNGIKTENSVFKVKQNTITFASSEIKLMVMSKFVATCLKSDEDFQAYIGTSSPDSLMEYCRLWNYKRDVEEACVFLPQKLMDDYIKRINIDAVIHVMVEDREDSDGENRSQDTRQKISKLLDIPLEVMSWDINSRGRYAERIKREGKKKMFRARGMLVGCTGAGKTTLLRRLQRKPTSDTQQPTETTIGLEIHKHMFQIQYGALKDHEDKPTDFHSVKQLISMTDFAGQAAYYACHQVYLSRRAFYLLLVDMSKRLDEEAHEHNRERHDPVGSLFHHWTYRNYFTFWLQCIKTYCEVGDRRTADDIERFDRQNPVILVASHKDESKSNTSTASDFFQELRGSLPRNQTLEHLLSPDRYLEVECPTGSLSPQQEDMIEDVRKCIVHTVENLYHWGEQIPLSWAGLEDVLNEKKERRILRRSMLKGLEQLKSLAKSDIDDMLRFFHEIGQIIYFADEKLRDVIIIDVQWFVDGFKNIITDQKHFSPGNLDDEKMMKSGRITELTLRRIWGKENEKKYVLHMADLLPYMEKLGLMVEIKTQKRQSPAGKTFYIPSMNTVGVRDVHFETINAGQKTSILMFHFKTYLPHFFFFRLVVHCFKKWDALSQDMFCKNAAFFKDKDECIAIAVNETSIQLQVFTRSQSINLKDKQVVKIRSKVERIIREITQTFHKQVTYEIGYSCKDIKITDEDQNDFLLEGEIFPIKRGESERKCPLHVTVDESHDINTQDLLRFWRK